MFLVRAIRSTACAAFAATLITGCGGNEVVQPTVSVSIGQQLIDLKNARDTNAISPRDYEQQKRQLIDSVK